MRFASIVDSWRNRPPHERWLIGVPVVALATTEAVEAVPPDAGVISTDVDVLTRELRDLVNDRERARWSTGPSDYNTAQSPPRERS